jgi:hypothetical protein
MDYRATQRAGQPAIEFSWQGVSEGDELCGRGWATLSDTILSGHIFIHNSDDSGFKATRNTMRQRRAKPGGG